MGGLHRKNNVGAERASIIETWMLKNAQDHDYKRYDDLHIHQIDERWKSRESWIEGGLEAFQLAAELRDRHRLNLRVVLAFSLLATDKPCGVDFKNVDELKIRLNSSPPSLYLFETGKEPRTESGVLNGKVIAESVVVQNVDRTILPPPLVGSRVYLMEFKQIDFEEYSRSVLVEG